MVTKIFDKQLKNNLDGIPTAPTAPPETNNNQIATTAYADAKVADAINDGVTGIAPSQNAVFDALALKVDIAPITIYTHTANKEAHCTAVDIDTNIFTSSAHPLVDGDMVWAIVNQDAGKVIPLNIYPGGIVYKGYPGYYVGVVDANSFKLYSDADRTTEVNITANVNMDLSKFHFETHQKTIAFTGLSGKKYKIKINGKVLRNDAAGGAISINTVNSQYDYAVSNNGSYDAHYIGGGDVFYTAEIDCNATGILTVKNNYYLIKSNTTTNFTAGGSDTVGFNPLIINTNINTIAFADSYFANGTRFEVYKI